MSWLDRLRCAPPAASGDLPLLSDNDFPALYRAADTHSVMVQKRYFRILLLELTLLVLAAVLSVWNSPTADLAIAQALALVATLACVVFLFWAKPDRHWYSARAVAESVKTTTWRYVTRSEPFNSDDAAARDQFGQRLKAIVDQNRDIAQRLCSDLDGAQISDAMEALRRSSYEDRKTIYLRDRVDEQLRWYARKSKINDCLGKRFFVLLLAVILAALALAIFKVRFPNAAWWPTDAIVALASVLLTWIQSKRFSELAASYALAAHEISLIQLQSNGVATEAELSAFVGDAENAFSREHTQWVARKDAQ